MYAHQNLDNWLGASTGVVIGTPAADPIATALFKVGYQPIMTVAIYALITVATTVAATILTFKFRPTLGSATGEIAIGTLTIPIAAVVGTMYYKTVDNVKCLPGGEVVVQTNGGATVGSAAVGFMAAPNWDSPGNNLKMIRSV